MMRDDVIRKRMKAQMPSPTPLFAGRVRQTLDRLPERKRFSLFRYLPAAAMAVVAVAVIGLAVMSRMDPGGNPLNALTEGQTAATDEVTSVPSPAILESTATDLATAAPTPQDQPGKQAMPENLAVIGKYETKIKAVQDKSRLNNIRIACAQLDGLTLNPGQTLSFNQLVMSQELASGYSYTPVLSSEENMPQGVCQVGTTLHNAALLADLEIKESHRHNLPVTYVQKGLDVTVDASAGKDLVLSNPHSFPIWIKASLGDDNNAVNIILYGQPWQGKHPTSLDGKTVLTKSAPKEPVLVEDDTVPKGETRVVPARSGYIVDVIRHWIDPSTNEQSDETLYSVEYKASAVEIHYPPGEKPKDIAAILNSSELSGTLEPTPAPEATDETPELTAAAPIDAASSEGRSIFGNKTTLMEIQAGNGTTTYVLKVEATDQLKEYYSTLTPDQNGMAAIKPYWEESDKPPMLIFLICTGVDKREGVERDRMALTISACKDNTEHGIYVREIDASIKIIEDGDGFLLYLTNGNLDYQPTSNFTIFTCSTYFKTGTGLEYYGVACN